MFRRTLLATIAALALTAGAARADDAVLKFGADSSPYPPFASQGADGKWSGFEVDLMNAVCAAESLKCEMVGTAFDGIIPALQAKKIDVIWASMSITPERKKQVSFTSKYYNTPAEIVAQKTTDLKLSKADPSALKGKVIGVQASTIHANYVQKHFGDMVTLKTYDSQDNANADLVAGRVDAVMADSIVLNDFLSSPQGKDVEVKMTIPADDDRAVMGDGVGGAVRNEDAALLAKLDDGIAKIRADGTYDKIAKQYFKFDVYGG